MTSHGHQWDERLRDTLAECQGEFLVQAWVDEMGLYGPDEKPSFTHPELEFVQALMLELRFESGRTLQVGCWQDDDEFALWPRRAAAEDRLSPNEDPSRTLFRVRPMNEFPAGHVRSVDWQLDERGNIQVISLRLDTGEALVRAGEVYEHPDGSLEVKDRDESVLIFVDRGAHERTVFNARAYRVE